MTKYNGLKIWDGTFDSDGNPRVVELDGISTVLSTIDYPHKEIHGQLSFICGYADIVMADTDTFVIAFKTPAGTKRIHLTFGYDALVGCHIDFYKDSTWDANQTPADTLLPIYNRFQLDTPKSSIILENAGQVTPTATDNMILDPTNHSAGDKIRPTVYGFGKNQKFSTSGGDRDELVLEPDTNHSIVYTADGNSNSGMFILDWYEHTDNVAV